MRNNLPAGRAARLLRALMLLPAMLLLTGLLVPATAHAQESAPSHQAPVQAGLQGVHLTATQAEALRRAAAGDPGLTREQAAKLIPAIGHFAPDAAGRGRSSGPCGVAELWGDSFGHYRFGVTFNTEVVGNPSPGAVSVSTNGQSADNEPFGLSGRYTGNDLPGSAWYTLSTIGWGATATTMNGWALTTGAWFCTIAITANWVF